MENRFAKINDNKMSSQSKYRSQNLRKDDARQKSKGPKSLGAEKTKMETPHSLKDENSKAGLILPKVKNQQKPTILNASRAERLEALHRKINVNNSGIE